MRSSSVEPQGTPPFHALYSAQEMAQRETPTITGNVIWITRPRSTPKPGQRSPPASGSAFNYQPASVRLYVFQFVKGAEQAKLGRGVLFRLGQRTAVSCGPGRSPISPAETRSPHRSAFGRKSRRKQIPWRELRDHRQRGAFPYKVVLVNVSLGTGVGLQATHGLLGRHADIMNDRPSVCPAYRPCCLKTVACTGKC